MNSNPKNWLCEGAVRTDANGNNLWVFTGEYTATGAPIDKLDCINSPGALDNNLDTVQATIQPHGKGLLTSACPYPNHNLGPKRDCEFSLRTAFDSCTPGAQVSLTCTAPASTPAQVLRVCESSVELKTGTACRYNEAQTLANVILTPGVATPVSFTCPAARDGPEVGGKYSTYYGPLFNPDALASSISCTAA
jgi:hypothetical protein